MTTRYVPLIGDVIASRQLSDAARRRLQSQLLAKLAVPRAIGLWRGRVAMLGTGYLYICGRGMTLVRAVLKLPTLRMRRDEDRTTSAIDVARGRAIGVLERALALIPSCCLASTGRWA